MESASFKILRFSRPFPIELDVQYTPIRLGNISTSSLSKEHVRSFPLAIAFKKDHRSPFNLSVFSQVDWCSVTPDTEKIDDQMEFINLSLNLNLDALAKADCQRGEDSHCHHELQLDIGVSEPGALEDSQHDSFTIPVDIYWHIDIPFGNPGKPQVDKTDIVFAPIHLPGPPDEPQVEHVRVTNVGDTRVICDLRSPDWIKVDPERLVLEPGKARSASIWIDPTYVNAGGNSGQIHITNSDININVAVDIVVHGPAPQLESDISISIPQTDADYTYELEIINVGEGDLEVSLPTNIGDLGRKKIYHISDKARIPLTISQDKLREGETVTRDFVVRTNSVIESLREISVRFQYTVPAQEEPSEEPILVPPKPGPHVRTTKKRERSHAATLVAAVVAVFLIIGIGIAGYFAQRQDESSGVTTRRTEIVKTVPAEQKYTPAETSERKRQQKPSSPARVSSDSRKTKVREFIPPDPVFQPKKPKPPMKPESYIRVSIYSFPRARIYIDQKKFVDSEGKEQLTPVRDVRIKSGEHIIELVADNDPSRTWSVQRTFTEDCILTINAMEGDW